MNKLFYFLTHQGQYNKSIWKIKEVKDKMYDYDPDYLVILLRFLDFRKYVVLLNEWLRLIEKDFVYNGNHLDLSDLQFIGKLKNNDRERPGFFDDFVKDLNNNYKIIH